MGGVTLNIISRELSDRGIESSFDKVIKRRFLDVRILQEGDSDTSLLYVTDDADLVGKAARRGLSVLFAGPAELAPPGAAGSVSGRSGLVGIFTVLQQISFKYRKWERNLDESLLAEEGLQRLLDLSADIVVNHIDIVDPAMKLLAHTDDSALCDPITNGLVELGYHSEETISRFRLDNRFRLWSESDGFIVNTERKISRYPSILYCFKAKDSFTVIAVMICDKLEPCDYLFDVYRMLLERIEHYVHREYRADGIVDNATGAFLRALLHGEISSEEEIAARASVARISREGPYCVFYFGLEDSSDIPVVRFLADVAEKTIPAVSLTMDGGIIVLCSNCRNGCGAGTCSKGTCPLGRVTVRQRIAALLEAYGRICACSATVSSLDEVSLAYRQAKETYDLYRGLAGNDTCSKRIVCFDEAFLPLALGRRLAEQNDLAASSQGIRTLREICAYDEEHQTDYYGFLRCYLENERRTVKVSELCHMHRNNIAHKVKRIGELFGVSFDDPARRCDLLLAYRALDFYGAID